MNKLARYVQVRRVNQIPDDKLIISGKQFDLPPDHFYRGCCWATELPDRIVCPFVYGSCVRVPGSMEKPNIERLHRRVEYAKVSQEVQEHR